MDWSRFGKNLLFAAVLFLVVSSIDVADLPLTNRMEEYIAFVLTTDFDYRRWLEEAKLLDLLSWDLEAPWTQRTGGGRSARPAESFAGAR